MAGVDSIAAEGEAQLTGDVTVSEGSGITLTQAGQDIEIALAVDPDAPPVGDFVAWLDASDAATIVTSGGVVTEWQDKSPNGFDFRQTVVAQQPEYGARTINGIAVPDFRGDEHLLSVAPCSDAVASAIFAVALSDTGSSNRGLLGSQVNGGMVLYQTTANKMAMEETGVGGVEAMTAGITIGTAFATGHVFDGSTIRQYLDGASESEAHAITPTLMLGSCFLGLYNGVGWWDGLIAELILYYKTLTDPEALSIMAYLKAKWGTP